MPVPPEPDHFIGVLDDLPTAVFALDLDGRFVYANRAAQCALGGSRILLGSRLLDVAPETATNGVLSALERAIRTGETTRVEAWLPSFGGWFEAVGSPSPEMVTVSCHETTGRRRDEMATRLHENITAALDPDTGPMDTLQSVAVAVRQATDAELVELWVADGPGDRLRLVHMDHDDDPALEAFASASPLYPSEPRSAPQRAIESRSPDLLGDLTAPMRFGRHELAREARLRTAIYLPLVVPGTPPAVIGLLSRQDLVQTDWYGVLAGSHAEVVTLVTRQRERHDLRQMFRLSHDLLVVVGLDGTFRRVNPRWTQTLGHTASSLLGERFLDLVHPDDLPATRRALETVTGGSPVVGFRNRYRTADGDYRSLSWDVQPASSEGLLYGVARDVTDELREHELETVQRQVLRGIVEGQSLRRTLDDIARGIEVAFPELRVSIHRFDADTNTLHVVTGPSLPDAYLEAIDALPVGPAAGSCGTSAHRRQAVIVEDTAADPLWHDYIDLARTHGLAASWSQPVSGADGELLGTLAAYRAERGSPGRDEKRLVTDMAQLAGLAIGRERATTQLAERERRLQVLASATSDVIWDWDVATDTITWGKNLCLVFGHARSSFGTFGRGWTAHIHPDDRAVVLTGLHTALEGDAATWRCVYRFERADGRFAHVLDRGSIIRDGHGRAIRMIGGMVDETERYELEEQYLRAQRLESIGALAGGVAHDLNNMLTPISMAAEILAAGDLDPYQHEMVETIAASAERGADVVRQVLTFARGFDRGQRRVDPRALLEDVAKMARDTFPKNIRVEVADVDGVWEPIGDPGQLQQVLVNLAVNARDAMPDGGTLALAAQNRDLDAVYAAMEPGVAPGRFVELLVSDTGAGMPTAVRGRIFEPFFTTKDVGEGTGLGLSTSRAIVANHEGFIDVVSEPGRGSTFRIFIPAVASPDATPRQEAARHLPRGRGELLLVVDDEAAVRAMMHQALVGLGYRVVTASDGAEAVAIFARRRGEIAVVITDLMMPVMDGSATIDAVRRMDSEVPIIACTGLLQPSEALAHPVDVDHLLVKPFTSESLVRTVAISLKDGR